MSTNIQIDVVLQRLQEQARQVLGQNRSERQEREDAQLQAQQSTQAEDQAAGNATRLAPQNLAAQRTVAAEEHSRVPDTYKKRRPAAQINVREGIFAIELLTDYAQETNEFKLKVSVPNTAHQLEVTAESSGRGEVEMPYYENVAFLFTVYGRVSRDADTGFWSVYRDGSFGGGTNFTDRLAEPPRSHDHTDIYYTRSQRIGEKSTPLMLPLSSTDAVFIYIHNRIEINHIYERRQRSVFSSVNERNINLSWGELGYQADWDAEGHINSTYTKYSQTDFAAYEIFAFYVSETGVKQIGVPETLETHLRAIFPPVSANGTGSFLRTIDTDWYYDHNPAAFVDRISSNYTTTYQDEPAFDANVWAANSRYGTSDWQKTALAQHFGLGYLNTSFHYGEFFTPAVYTYLNGPMNLNTDSAWEYDYMRANYFRSAPFTFYAPCARANACQDDTVTEFDVLRRQPTNVTVPVDSRLFSRNPATDVTIGEPEGVVYYAWDWNKPEACRKELLSLGFRTSDLTL